MIGGRHSLCLPILGHNIADVHLKPLRRPNRVGHPLDQQIGNHAGIQAPWPQKNQIGLPDGFQGLGQCCRPFRQEPYVGNAAVLHLFKLKDFRLPHHMCAVLKYGLQGYVCIGNREHPA